MRYQAALHPDELFLYPFRGVLSRGKTGRLAVDAGIVLTEMEPSNSDVNIVPWMPAGNMNSAGVMSLCELCIFHRILLARLIMPESSTFYMSAS